MVVHMLERVVLPLAFQQWGQTKKARHCHTRGVLNAIPIPTQRIQELGRSE